ncbi:MAG TPA: family 20 glycosylhydrolase [Terriglobales bacterium]|nr:family 20 glycosylhydrolase [Terriglobales bacterium]
MRIAYMLSALWFMFTALAAPGQETMPPLMPMPANVTLGSGQFIINQSFSVAISGANDARLQHAVEHFLENLSRQTGMRFPAGIGSASQAALTIHAEQASHEIPQLGEDESYSLVVTPAAAMLTAPTTLGVLRGLETFRQMVDIGPQGFALPAVTVHDQPRFPWRGLLIDVSRHFMPVEVLKRNLDGMAAVKLNVLHWHLSDDQGFRVESKKFPKLQETGSDGQYYSQKEIREVIEYAAERGIRVIPEFDMPGHTTAWFVGYPELASAPGPYQIERKWGIFDPTIDPTRDDTYHFLDKLIGEMASLFPDAYFHVGGDEVNGKQWSANPQIQHFLRSHGMKNNDDLQAYFNQRILEIVKKHGKIMVGWDEILHPNLPKDIVVQSWRGQSSLAAAARQGYRGILSHGYYLDLMQSASYHYSVEPLANGAADLNPEEKARILGGEACMWSEYVSPETIDSRIWPRLAVIAERLWSAQSVRDVDSMYQRMDAISERLDWLGLKHRSNYDPMLSRLVGNEDTRALRVLADVVEPVKEYARSQMAEYTSFTPLNHLVDAARPESETGRRFASMVDAILSGRADETTRMKVRAMLTLWRDNHARLMPQIENSALLKEVGPLSEDLSMLGSAGLQALDSLQSGTRLPDAWSRQQLALIEQAKKPKAALLLMVAPSVQKLVEASAHAAASSAGR